MNELIVFLFLWLFVVCNSFQVMRAFGYPSYWSKLSFPRGRIHRVASEFRLFSSTRSSDEIFMKLALRHAQHAAREREVPIGAVLVDENNTVIATGRNAIESSFDATAHAEIECLRKASQLLKTWRLNKYTLYTTVEPCAMCLSSIQAFRVKRLVFGTADSRLGACGSWVDLFNSHPYHQVEVQGGILADESAVLLRRFFQNLRVEKDKESEFVSTLRGSNCSKPGVDPPKTNTTDVASSSTSS
jgi:tRNA(adenine34) deaminase